jgi:ATP-binding cassette subfamily F protein uup
MDNPISAKSKKNKPDDAVNKGKSNKNLSYKFKLELEKLPEKIATLEQMITKLEEQTSDDDFYAKPYTEQQPILDDLRDQQDALDKAIRRWDELETMAKELQTH